MSVRTVVFADAVSLESPGAPYYAFVQALRGTGAYRPSDYVEFMTIVEGEGVRIVTNSDGTLTTTRLRPGEFYIFPPGETQEVYSTSHETMREFNVAFPATTWRKFVEMAELDPGWTMRPSSPLAIVDVESPRIVEPFRRAAERFAAGPTAIDLIEFLVAIIPVITPASPVEMRRVGPPWLRDVLTAMAEEDNLRAGLPRLTELARVSRMHLWRTIRQCTGLTPTEFVRTIRLRHAASLLMRTDEAVASIAERCGFPNPAHFSQAFRRFHGAGPLGYRRRARHRDEDRGGSFLGDEEGGEDVPASPVTRHSAGRNEWSSSP